MERMEETFTYFYTDPRPERLYGLIDQFPQENWEAYPPLAGFLAIVFNAHPEHIERLLPAHFNPRSSVTIAVALRLSSHRELIAKFHSKFEKAGCDARLNSELAGLPVRLADIEIKTPSHLDILWGAVFASGDTQYVLAIVNFLAKTINRSAQVTIDVFRLTGAMMQIRAANAMSSEPQEVVNDMRQKYGDTELARDIVVACTALWALRSNALQHPFIEHLFADIAAGHPGTPIAVALSNLRSGKQLH